MFPTPRLRWGRVAVVTTAILGAFVASAFALTLVCEPIGQSTKTVIPGVTLTWDSSFHGENAPDQGQYKITVRVANASSSTEAVWINAITLRGTTPRPRGQAPYATAVATGLPLTIAPGETRTFDVSGDYKLVMTDEGKKANLHLAAHGHGVTSGTPFRLGINVHLRAPGVPLD